MLQSPVESGGLWRLVYEKGVSWSGLIKQVFNTLLRTYGMLKPNAYLNFGKMIAATEK